MVLGLHALALLAGLLPLRDWWRDNPRRRAVTDLLRPAAARSPVRLSGWGQSHDLAGILYRFFESLGDAAALLVDRDGRYGRIKGAIIDELRATQPPAPLPNALGQHQPRLAGGARLRRRPVPCLISLLPSLRLRARASNSSRPFSCRRASSPAGRRRNRGRPGQACLPARGRRLGGALPHRRRPLL